MTRLETNATVTPLGDRRRHAAVALWRIRERSACESTPAQLSRRGGHDGGPRRPRARATCGTLARSPSSARPSLRHPGARLAHPVLLERRAFNASPRRFGQRTTWFETGLPDPERVEGRLDLRPGAHRAPHHAPRRRWPTTRAACRATRPCSPPPRPATGSCGWPQRGRVRPRPGRHARHRRRPGDGDDRHRGHRARRHDGRARTAGRRHESEGRVGHELRARRAADDRRPDGDDHRRRHRRGPRDVLFAPAAAGDTNVKVDERDGFVVGEPLVDGEVRTVTAVGTQGRITTLAAAAAAGDTIVKVAERQRLSRRRHADRRHRRAARRARSPPSARPARRHRRDADRAVVRPRERRRRPHAGHRHHARDAARRRARPRRRHARPRHRDHAHAGADRGTPPAPRHDARHGHHARRAAGQRARRGRGDRRPGADRFCRLSSSAHTPAPARRSGPRRCCASPSTSRRSPSTAPSTAHACTRPASPRTR